MTIEYLVQDIPARTHGTERVEMLNAAGQAGWQMCGVLNIGPIHQYTFSREKELILGTLRPVESVLRPFETAEVNRVEEFHKLNMKCSQCGVIGGGETYSDIEGQWVCDKCHPVKQGTGAVPI